jgi:catechol 2,3-dioxygenase-like lactoylglutathione lyase family enzyme
MAAATDPFAPARTRPLAGADLVAFVAARDLERARRFYRDTLGLALTDEDEYGLMFDVAGTPLRVALVENLPAAPHTVLGWQVADVAGAISALVARGVAFERYPFFDQDALGVWTAPAGARVAWFKDPDGNTLSLTEPAPARWEPTGAPPPPALAAARIELHWAAQPIAAAARALIAPAPDDRHTSLTWLPRPR